MNYHIASGEYVVQEQNFQLSWGYSDCSAYNSLEYFLTLKCISMSYGWWWKQSIEVIFFDWINCICHLKINLKCLILNLFAYDRSYSLLLLNVNIMRSMYSIRFFKRKKEKKRIRLMEAGNICALVFLL